MQKNNMTRLQIMILGVLSAFGPLALDLYLPGLPVLQRELHTTATMTQLSITAAMFGLAIGQVVVGPLSDRLGRKMPLIYGIAAFTIASFGIAMSDNIGMIIVLRLIQGLGGATGIVLSLAMITDSFDGIQLTRNVAINQTINGIFPILAPVLGGVLIALADWRSAFWLLGGLGLIIVLLIIFKLPETNLDRQNGSIKETFGRFKSILENRYFMAMTLIQGFMMSALFAYIAGSSFVLQDLYGLSVPAFSGVYALNGFGILLGASLSGKLAEKYSAWQILKWFMMFSMVGGLLLIVSLFLPKSIWLTILAFFLIVAPVGGINSMTTALVMAREHQDAGTASGILGLTRFAMGGIMSPLVGLGGTTTMVPLVIVIVVVQLLGAGIYAVMQHKQPA
ncbi:multidrug effflux MFS transporter [Weissella viridescens]|uniref:multidrug effflux MFS transporter n=3 Tax=Weissella viridescens TaxID=1629 RepID=UPI002574CE76|nr:multidrug effflux MFS transporter [Weissella viridescens]WJI91812.1 multidrug effflux MFS transporter [Weissella viridescens]